jgi:hypothetical protein
LNFIDFIVAPLFVSMRQLLPKATKCLVHLKDNRNDWAKLYAQNIERSQRSKEEKMAEKKRWIRRTESFHQILLLPADVAPISHSSTLVAGGNKRMSSSTVGARRRNSILVCIACHLSHIVVISGCPFFFFGLTVVLSIVVLKGIGKIRQG